MVFLVGVRGYAGPKLLQKRKYLGRAVLAPFLCGGYVGYVGTLLHQLVNVFGEYVLPPALSKRTPNFCGL